MQLSYAVVNGHMCGHDVSLFNIVLVTVWCVHESDTNQLKECLVSGMAREDIHFSPQAKFPVLSGGRVV